MTSSEPSVPGGQAIVSRSAHVLNRAHCGNFRNSASASTSGEPGASGSAARAGVYGSASTPHYLLWHHKRHRPCRATARCRRSGGAGPGFGVAVRSARWPWTFAGRLSGILHVGLHLKAGLGKCQAEPTSGHRRGCAHHVPATETPTLRTAAGLQLTGNSLQRPGSPHKRGCSHARSWSRIPLQVMPSLGRTSRLSVCDSFCRVKAGRAIENYCICCNSTMHVPKYIKVLSKDGPFQFPANGKRKQFAAAST